LIFLDISRDRNNFYMVLGSSAGVGLLGLFMVFVLVVFFSRLVTLARIDEKGTPDMVVDFSMSDAVEETAASFQAPALARGKKLLVTVEKDVTCYGDEKEIRQFFV